MPDGTLFYMTSHLPMTEKLDPKSLSNLQSVSLSATEISLVLEYKAVPCCLWLWCIYLPSDRFSFPHWSNCQCIILHGQLVAAWGQTASGRWCPDWATHTHTHTRDTWTWFSPRKVGRNTSNMVQNWNMKIWHYVCSRWSFQGLNRPYGKMEETQT